MNALNPLRHRNAIPAALAVSLVLLGGLSSSRASAAGVAAAAREADVEAVRVLLEAGANPDAVNPKGDTALHIAAHDGRLGPIRELVAGGASVDARNADGLTPLELVEKMEPRKLSPLAEMIGLFDDGAQPAETAEFLRGLISARP